MKVAALFVALAGLAMFSCGGATSGPSSEPVPDGGLDSLEEAEGDGPEFTQDSAACSAPNCGGIPCTKDTDCPTAGPDAGPWFCFGFCQQADVSCSGTPCGSRCPGGFRDAEHRCQPNPPADCPGGPPCTPYDARGTPNCQTLWGFTWDGTKCVAIVGCECVGADCATLVRDQDTCVADFQCCIHPETCKGT